MRYVVYVLHCEVGNLLDGVTVCVIFEPGTLCGGANFVPPSCHEYGISHSLVVRYLDKLDGTVYVDHVTVE